MGYFLCLVLVNPVAPDGIGTADFSQFRSAMDATGPERSVTHGIYHHRLLSVPELPTAENQCRSGGQGAVAGIAGGGSTSPDPHGTADREDHRGKSRRR